MALLISCDGVLRSDADPVLSVGDRGFLFGDGVFTTIRLKDGAVENIGRHFARLKSDCRSLNINKPEIPEKWIKDLILANNAVEGIWRLKIIITGGTSKELGLPERKAGSVVMTLSSYEPPFFGELHKLVLFPFPLVSPTAKIKSLACLDRLWIKNFARQNGAFDILATGEDGVLLEAAFANIFWISNGVFYTPAFELPLLKGIYLSTLLEGVEGLNLELREVKANIASIPADAAVYICNSLMGIQPVDSIETAAFARNEHLFERLNRTVQNIILSDQVKVL